MGETVSQITRIKRLLADGVQQSIIADTIGVSRSYVSHVHNGKYDARNASTRETHADETCSRCGFTGHTRRSCLVKYVLKLTRDEVNALYFIGARYSWTRVLIECDEERVIMLEESEMWEWQHDVEDDMAGGHSPFPMASPAFAEKLRVFLDECV